ncbi:TonB-dependent receptor plug domain-containing protein [Sphingomonas sp. UYP23]
MRDSVRILASVSGLAIGIWSVAAAQAQTTPPPQTSGPAATPTTAAPQPPEADPADIVVTGLRGSLASAQAIKRNSEQIVDSITAQDIGKFPDTNIAESLQRISGIQIQRNLGEGSTVAIRGLSEVRTELNGHDIFTANGGSVSPSTKSGPTCCHASTSSRIPRRR